MVDAFLLLLVVCDETQSRNTGNDEDDEQLAPDAFPERRLHVEFQRSHVFAPFAMRIGGDDLEYIVAMRDSVEADAVLSSKVDPYAFGGMSVDAVFIVLLVLACIVECGKADGQVAFVGWDDYLLLVQDRYVLVASVVVQLSEDNAGLIVGLLQSRGVERQAARSSAYCDVVGYRVVNGACLREGHVEVEVVGTEDGQFPCFGVVFIDTRLPDEPDVATVVLYHALHISLAGIDEIAVSHLQIVLQQVFACYYVEGSSDARYIGIAVGTHQDVVDV